ncbi:hypothetical protein BH10PSE9_BH10PSE9_07470 [soil metagenome]
MRSLTFSRLGLVATAGAFAFVAAVIFGLI